MNVRFRYEDLGKSHFGTILRPIAKVHFNSVKTRHWIETWLIVDTGADFTILPRYIAKDLEISLVNNCIKDTTIGVGGHQEIYLCKFKIKARIGNLERMVPLGFFNGDEIPALLGRLGFMETFDVEFLKSHTVVFKD